MENLLVTKERIKNFYYKYEKYIKICVRFLISLISFLIINNSLGYFTKLNNNIIVVVLALACAFVNINFAVVISSLLVVVHTMAFSMEAALIIALVLIVLFFSFFRYSRKEGYLLIITPIVFFLKIPYAIPLVMGMIGTPFSAIPIAGGVIVFFMVRFISNNSASISKAYADEMVNKIEYLLQQLLTNKEMLLVVAAFVISFILVYVIRRMAINNSWEIALVIATIANMVILLIGDFAFGIQVSILWLVIGNINSLGIAFVFKFFRFTVDYSRIEKVQFEDDEYYYYVKAVPKVFLAEPDKVIKRFNTEGTVTEEISSEELEMVKNIDEINIEEK